VSVSRDKAGSAAKQSTVRRFVKSFVAIRNIRHAELPHDGKRTLANAAIASLLRRKHHSLEQCGTPSRELEGLLVKA
jgi:hypothetical protein